MKSQTKETIAFFIFFICVILLTVTAFTYKNSVPVEEPTEEVDLAAYSIFALSFLDTDNNGYGDIQGISSKVDYFVDLGVNTIWISPIYKSPMKDFGYDIENYIEIDPIFGTMEDFDNMIKTMHAKGIRVVLDFVPNHTSDQHEWFRKSIKREDPYDNYYIWEDPSRFEPDGTPVPPNNWLSVFKNSAWEWNDERKQYYYHQFLKEQPDLNLRNPKVCKELEDVLKFWLDKGVDGFRADAVKHLFEKEKGEDEPVSSNAGSDPTEYSYLYHTLTANQPENFKLVASWKKLLETYSDRLLMVEVCDDVENVMKYYGTEEEPISDFPFNFDLITSFRSRKDVIGTRLKESIEKWTNEMPKGKWPNWVLGNHDEGRISSRIGQDLVDAMNMLLLLLPGTPVTYQGEEIGMTNTEISYEECQDPAGLIYGPDRYIEFTRDPQRTPMQWNTSKFAGFTNGSKTWLPVNPNYVKLNLETQKEASQSHFKVYQQLATLRKQPALTGNDIQFVYNTEDILAFVRKNNKDDCYLIVINTSVKNVDVDLSSAKDLPTFAKVVVRSSSDERAETKPGSTAQLNKISLIPGEGIVFSFSESET